MSLKITLHGHSTFHAPWKNPMTFSAVVGFAAAWVLGFVIGFLPCPAFFHYFILSVTSQNSYVPAHTDVTCLWMFSGFLPVCNFYGST